MRGTVGALMLVVIAVAMVTVFYHVPLTKAQMETIYIRADGSIDPPSAPIQKDGNLYALTDNITSTLSGIAIERNNTILDGAGFTIQGPGTGISGYALWNVTIREMRIEAFRIGIHLMYSYNNTISGNNVTVSQEGITLLHASYNTVRLNKIEATTADGILIYSGSAYNNVAGNNITRNNVGIFILGSSLPYTPFSLNNRIYENNIADNGCGLAIQDCDNNFVYRNRFFENIHQASCEDANALDNGFEGNYWSDYNGTDSNHDGIGDTPYVINSNNTDHFPLMNPYWSPSDVNHDLKVNILDIVTICGLYGTTPLDPRWNPHADIAQPLGKIDILDVTLCISQYGETYLRRAREFA